MSQRNNDTDSFYGWIRGNKYSVYIAVFCAVLPLVAPLFIELVYKLLVKTGGIGNSYWKSLLEHQFLFQAVNIFFIIFALYKLTRMKFSQDRTREREKKLHQYVTDTFGPNSSLARNSEENLFKRINTGLKQFYYSWVCVWSIWLIMYIIKLIYTFYQVNEELYCKGTEYTLLFRIDNFLENTLNMIGSCVMFFIYMDITVSTVNVGTLTGKRHSNLQVGVFCMIFIGTLISIVDLFSIIGCTDYDKTQFYLRLYIGLIASIAIMAVLGRLNTSYLQIPQPFMMSLYLYASVQIFYPLVYKMSNAKDDYYIYFLTPYLTICLDVLAFLGKVALLLVLLWIAKKNRFLFFLLHKANSLSDASFMIDQFNKFYGNGSME